jgi:hypothetical protein
LDTRNRYNSITLYYTHAEIETRGTEQNIPLIFNAFEHYAQEISKFGLPSYFVSYFTPHALRAVFPAATATDDIGCFIRKPVDMDDLVKRINAEIQ